MSTALIVLAAGMGTRMNSDLPKVLHEIAGAPMLHHAIASGLSLEPEEVIVVAGHGAKQVSEAAADSFEGARIVIQAEQNGTAHAVGKASALLAQFEGDVIVLYGDTPFIRSETLAAMKAARDRHDVVVLGFEAADPGRYGRLVMDGEALERIVEFKDATEEERAITLCNSGVLCADRKVLFDLVAKVGNDNAAGEYYLTDVIALAQEAGLSAGAVTCPEEETMGVNSRQELARAEAEFQARARAEAMENGVTLVAPETVQFAHDTVIGRDTVIEPNVVFGPDVTIESGCRIRAFSHLEGCHVSRGGLIGPYARLRPGAELAEEVHIGNFVEVKASSIDQGAKINHLSYIGDAHVGEATNIGAGTITCNYDGVLKHRTEIGARAFIGSNTMLVAPVTIGDEAMTGSGSVITSDVEAGAMAIGRARQVTKPGMARKLMEYLRSKKAQKAE
ncbi:bifunctional UDP-N-acetylglucosamine diphosphorylase/glucosamine-1-phosphate N-acetyltransferase GlmU [Pseudooceanicola sp. CBS1P-1]|uniref:Bifunctional protein GlmU n=1 Tax=Pseudooceanicola albus TaxID=2692189 RepID=A0A6L7G3A7_9RHOB|nr:MULTISPECIES: bifunctional UDP-N-acetylglucosamine diphosphorylase/glucosamine-1-phosphate N-acetyltransferase GlmU [Pseudooceanicola]MBT9382542.1 bifunctional UDP-N-acetylglucosamine diphosphorylase/glucosamine-1-phosphate N-acetyltransferase GlmU [Pseudooceanicola endophyticus]MXN17083.1 bifunctional UDP-N-acetylglucosamine diphosphorylase/glucosamine-1-phosphate N-acetyltransferase GlmU [Pseudooceanicola albus]